MTTNCNPAVGTFANQRYTFPGCPGLEGFSVYTIGPNTNYIVIRFSSQKNGDHQDLTIRYDSNNNVVSCDSSSSLTNYCVGNNIGRSYTNPVSVTYNDAYFSITVAKNGFFNLDPNHGAKVEASTDPFEPTCSSQARNSPKNQYSSNNTYNENFDDLSVYKSSKFSSKNKSTSNKYCKCKKHH